MRRRKIRGGLTLIELCSTLAIISILMALVLPGVQSAREAARRAACQNNLHSIGLALQQYHEVNGTFPPSVLGYHSAGPPYTGMHSVQARILPFLDSLSIYNSINFSVSTYAEDTFEYPPLTVAQMNCNALNQTVINNRINLFICPSDNSMGGPANNYRGNAGIGPCIGMHAEHPDSGNGVFVETECISAARIPDGLSHTAAFSERLCGSLMRPINPVRDYYGQGGNAITGDDLVLACQIAARPGATGFVYGGRQWFWSGRERTLYTHTQVPNGIVPDCLSGSAMPARGMATARSFHPGGVNVLMCDGSNRFISDGVSRYIWRAFGTRNGSDLAD